jgi:hypothetical protein
MRACDTYLLRNENSQRYPLRTQEICAVSQAPTGSYPLFLTELVLTIILTYTLKILAAPR